MKSLRTLLKLAQRDLETMRARLAELIAQQTAIEESVRTLAENVAFEQKSALKDYESGRAYGGFALYAVGRGRALEGDAANIAAEIERVRALVTEAHVEMRKFEHLVELEETRAKKAAAKREGAELDEMATQRAGRQR